MIDAQPMISVSGMRVSKNGDTICCVSELEIGSGERVAILGPNGSGKTTFLRVLSGLETNYDGGLSVNVSLGDRVYVHQTPYLFRGSVLSNVVYGLRQRRIGRGESERQALLWLERLGVRDLSHSCVTHLSGGERRRVALARAMVLEPRLLLLDEPLADIDANGSAAVRDALDELTQSTILIASPTALVQGLATRDYQISCTSKRDGFRRC